MIAMYGDPNDWGFILDFLSEDDPRPVREQFAERYIGGWHPLPGIELSVPASYTLQYPGDPPMQALSICLFRDEVIVLYPGDFVMVMQLDKSWEVSRMD